MAKRTRNSKKSTQAPAPVGPGAAAHANAGERIMLAQMSRDAKTALFVMTQASAAAADVLINQYQWEQKDAQEFVKLLIRKTKELTTGKQGGG